MLSLNNYNTQLCQKTTSNITFIAIHGHVIYLDYSTCILITICLR